MFHTDSDRLPKRPIGRTLTAATAELTRWLEENCLTAVRDADGQRWTLGLKVSRIPDPASTNGLLWSIRLGLTTSVTGADLVATGVLCPAKDSRLLAMIAEDSVPLTVRPKGFQAASEAEARALLAVKLPEIRENMQTSSLIEVKRRLIGRWVDGQCFFGGRL